MKNIAIALLFSFLSSPLFGKVSDSAKTKNFFLEFAPVASYDMGKCARFNMGMNRNRHSWYLGIQSHVNNFRDEGQPDNKITHKNGYAKDISHYLHLNLGYQRNFRVNPNFEPFFFVDIAAGRVGLVSKAYGFAGTDSAGIHHYYSTSLAFNDADFLQLSAGFGCRIRLTKAISLSSRIGVGEAFVSYRYNQPVNDGDINYTIDHFVAAYSLGIQYHFNKK